MDNSTAIPLHGKLLLLTQLELVSATTVAGTLYGISFTLFCLYVHSLVPRLRSGERKTQARFMLGFSSVIMFCGLFDLVSNAGVNQDAFIKHANYHGGPYRYAETTFQAPVLITLTTCQTAVNVFTSAIQIWRVWVVWNATRYANWVIVLPSLCFLISTALILRTVILETTPNHRAQLDATQGIVEIAMQAVITVLCTLLISLYLIFRHWRQRKLIGRAQGSTGYMGVAAILIESYALETIWLVTIPIIWRSPVAAFFNESLLYIQIIAYLLVQYRVASGTAYGSQEGQTKISSLHWNHSHRATTQFEETGDIHEIRASPHLSEKMDTSPVSSMA